VKNSGLEQKWKSKALATKLGEEGLVPFVWEIQIGTGGVLAASGLTIGQ
jgi:hypothetical protein